MTRAALRPIATTAASDAVNNIGVVEVGENRGKAVETYLASCKPSLGPGHPWCAAFVRYRMKAAATKLNATYDASFPRSAYTPDWANWAKENGRWIPVQDLYDGTIGGKDVKQVVLPGDLALFYFNTLGRIAHIGIIGPKPDSRSWARRASTNSSASVIAPKSGVVVTGSPLCPSRRG